MRDEKVSYAHNEYNVCLLLKKSDKLQELDLNCPYIILNKQDWVAFMSQPYWVEVKVEFELRLIWGWGWNEVDMRLSRNLVEIGLRLSWVGVEISWHWIEEEVGLS